MRLFCWYKVKVFSPPPPAEALDSLHFTNLLRTFALLIEKDGGIRPCDVLATCYLTRCYILLQPGDLWTETDKRKSRTLKPTFRYKLLQDAVTSAQFAVLLWTIISANCQLLTANWQTDEYKGRTKKTHTGY